MKGHILLIMTSGHSSSKPEGLLGPPYLYTSMEVVKGGFVLRVLERELSLMKFRFWHEAINPTKAMWRTERGGLPISPVTPTHSVSELGSQQTLPLFHAHCQLISRCI